MKSVAMVMLMSAIAIAAPKDLRVDVAKQEAAKLYRGWLPRNADTEMKVAKVNILEQHDGHFLMQVVSKNRTNYCLIFEVDLTDTTPAISVVANNNEVENVFIQQCSANPTDDELSQFKITNAWPVQ